MMRLFWHNHPPVFLPFCLLVLCFVLPLASCHRADPQAHYTIGVSIDFDDVWHNKMLDEIEQESVLHPEVELQIRNAQGDYALQCAQIDSLLSQGVDILLIGIGDPIYIREALLSAKEKGIPVVINAINPKVDDYTAYVGTDNYAAGVIMAQYLTEHAEKASCDSLHPLRAVEIVGVTGSPAVDQRYQGLHDHIRGISSVRITHTIEGNWDYRRTYTLIDSLLSHTGDIDVIVAQSDIMAFAAHDACLAHYPHRNFHILGVDALSGPDSGIEAILEGKIEASITNVSRGDLMVQTACHILHGEPYTRDTYLQPVLVDQSSKRLMMRMSEELNNEMKVIKTLQMRIDGLWGQANTLKSTNLTLIFCMVLVVLLSAVVIFLYRFRMKMHKERSEHAIELERQQQRLEQMSAELSRVKEVQNREEKFMQDLQNIIEKNLDDPELSIEMLASKLGISRAQLFRKVKSKTGVTPVDLIRQIRLQKAKQMLQHTDLSVSQVAYSVGFSSASYFAKCYKDFFGVAPKRKPS